MVLNSVHFCRKYVIENSAVQVTCMQSYPITSLQPGFIIAMIIAMIYMYISTCMYICGLRNSVWFDAFPYA